MLSDNASVFCDLCSDECVVIWFPLCSCNYFPQTNPNAGNKVRKLEYIFAEILEQGCDTVVTCGGVQSNHCRATAVAARRLGLDCHLFL